MDLSTKSTVPVAWSYENRLMCGSSSNNVSFQAATGVIDYELTSSNRTWWNPGGFQNSATFSNEETGYNAGRGHLPSNVSEYFHDSDHSLVAEGGQQRHPFHVTDTQCHTYSDPNGCWFQPFSMETQMNEPLNFECSQLSQEDPLLWNPLQSERRVIPIPSVSAHPLSIIPPDKHAVGIEAGLDGSTELNQNKNAFTVSLPGGKVFTIPLVIPTSLGAQKTPPPLPKKSRSKPRTVVYRPESCREKSGKSAFASVGKKGRANAKAKDNPLALLRGQGNPEEDTDLGGWRSPITDIPDGKQRRAKKSPKPSSNLRLPQPARRSPVLPVPAKNRLKSKKVAAKDLATKGSSQIVTVQTSEKVQKGPKNHKGSEIKKSSTGSALLKGKRATGTRKPVNIEKGLRVHNLSDESDENFGEGDEGGSQQDCVLESGVEERTPDLCQQSNLDMPDLFDLFPSTDASKSDTSNGLKNDDRHEIGLKDSCVKKRVEKNAGRQQGLHSANKLATNVNEMSDLATHHRNQSSPFFPSGSSSSSEDDSSENTAPVIMQTNAIHPKSRRPGVHWKKASRNFNVEEDPSLDIRDHTIDFHYGGSRDKDASSEEDNEVSFSDNHFNSHPYESEILETRIEHNGTMAAACNEKFKGHTPPQNNVPYSLYGNTNIGRPTSEIRSEAVPQETASAYESSEWGKGRISRNSSDSANFGNLRNDKLYDLTPRLPFLPLDPAPSLIQDKRYHFNRGPYDIQLKPLRQEGNSYQGISVVPAHLQRLIHLNVSHDFDVIRPIYNSDSKLGPFAHLHFLSDATSLPPNPSHNPFGYDPVEENLQLQTDGSYIQTPIFRSLEETRSENDEKNSHYFDATYTLHLCDNPTTGITETSVVSPNLPQNACDAVTRREKLTPKGRVTKIDQMGNKIVRRIAHASITKAPSFLFQMRNEDSSSDQLSTAKTPSNTGQPRPICNKIKLRKSHGADVCNESAPRGRKRGRPPGSKSGSVHPVRQSNRLGKTLKKFASTVGRNRKVSKIQQRLLKDIHKLYVLGQPTPNNSKSGLQSRTAAGLKTVHLSIPGPFERRVRTRFAGSAELEFADNAELTDSFGESRPHTIHDKPSKNACPCPPSSNGNNRTALPMSQDLPESISLERNFSQLSKDNDDADILSLHADTSLDDILNDTD